MLIYSMYKEISESFQAEIPKSLNVSFKEVFLSVLSLRFPIIKAQLTLYVPAGNAFG